MASIGLLFQLLLAFVLFATLISFEAQGTSLNRRRRELNYYNDEGLDDEPDYLDRDARRADRQPTVPPFPGYDDDYDNFLTEDPQTTPRYSSEPEPTNTTYEPEGDKEERFHEKILPWLKKKWHKTRDFFKKHFD